MLGCSPPGWALNAIIGYSEMLQEEAQDLQQEAFIPDTLLTEVRRLVGASVGQRRGARAERS